MCYLPKLDDEKKKTQNAHHFLGKPTLKRKSGEFSASTPDDSDEQEQVTMLFEAQGVVYIIIIIYNIYIYILINILCTYIYFFHIHIIYIYTYAGSIGTPYHPFKISRL